MGQHLVGLGKRVLGSVLRASHRPHPSVLLRDPVPLNTRSSLPGVPFPPHLLIKQDTVSGLSVPYALSAHLYMPKAAGHARWDSVWGFVLAVGAHLALTVSPGQNWRGNAPSR